MCGCNSQGNLHPHIHVIWIMQIKYWIIPMTDLAPVLLVFLPYEDPVMMLGRASTEQEMDTFNAINHSFAGGREMHWFNNTGSLPLWESWWYCIPTLVSIIDQSGLWQILPVPHHPPWSQEEIESVARDKSYPGQDQIIATKSTLRNAIPQ